MASLRLYFVLTLSALLVAGLIPLQYLAVRFFPKWANFIPMRFHRMILWLFGVRVILRGNISSTRPLLMVANHVSWLDILVLGSVQPVHFIAKSDMQSWPVLGLLAKLQQTIFIDRQHRRDVGNQADAIAQRLNQGDAIILFAEGTTSDGNFLLPFKSSLLGAAQASIQTSDHEAVMVQPVSITYTKLHGMAMGRFWRPVAAWPGDISIAEHLPALVKQGAIDVEISFGDPLQFDETSNRKLITSETERLVRRMNQTAMMGREIATLDKHQERA